MMWDRLVISQNLNGKKKKQDCMEIVSTEIISVLTVPCLVLINVNPFVMHLAFGSTSLMTPDILLRETNVGKKFWQEECQ